MLKDRSAHAKLIKQLESDIEQDPELYKFRVILLTLSGYGYILFVAVLTLVLSGFMILLVMKAPIVALQLGIPLLLVFWCILRSFWIQFGPIQGIILNRKEVPGIYEKVEEIRKKVGGPSVDEIVLVPDFNAAIVQRPRLGLLGWHKNYLLLGMELLQTLPYDQFRAVLAHEMGHLSGNHGKLTCWIYGARSSWVQLLQQLQADQSFATLLFRRFFSWFVPYFDAYTFVLARKQEYEADRFALLVEGAEAAARALINSRVKSSYTALRYWPALFKLAGASPTPPNGAYTSIANSVHDLSEVDAQYWLRMALAADTDYSDTHPCLCERLSAILKRDRQHCKSYAEKVLTELLRPCVPAAKELFGDQLTRYLQELDTGWADSMSEQWRLRHEELLELKKELDVLEDKAGKGTLEEHEFAILAFRTVQVKDFATARPMFHQAFEKSPDSPELNFVYGDCLLEADDEECIRYLERAMELDPLRTVDCCQMIYGFLKSVNQGERAEQYLDKAEVGQTMILEAQAERSKVTEQDSYQEHGLTQEEVSNLESQLANIQHLKKAYLFRKTTKHFPDRPQYLLLVAPPWHKEGQDVAKQISQTIVFPGATLIINNTLAPAKLRQAVKQIKNAELKVQNRRR